MNAQCKFNCYSYHLRTEQILEDSGVSVAPPERCRSGRINLKGKVHQEVSRDRRGSDISGDSGSEYEEPEGSGGEESEEKESDVCFQNFLIMYTFSEEHQGERQRGQGVFK